MGGVSDAPQLHADRNLLYQQLMKYRGIKDEIDAQDIAIDFEPPL